MILKGLPQELQVLGNGYTRDEFKRHKACKDDEAKIFMNEWTVSVSSLINNHHLSFPSLLRTMP